MPDRTIFNKIESGQIAAASALNPAIEQEFLRHRDDHDTRKTHLFDGRYENIYIDLKQLPSLQPVIETLRKTAAARFHCQPEDFKVGFWFNEMQPGHSTTLHAHDDFDEVLSAVYYVRAPDDSGNLVFYVQDEQLTITPEEGHYVMFPPELKHEVTPNQSQETRLSVGINLGLDIDL